MIDGNGTDELIFGENGNFRIQDISAVQITESREAGMFIGNTI